MRTKFGIFAIVLTLLAVVTIFNYYFHNPPVSEAILQEQAEAEAKLAQTEARVKEMRKERAEAAAAKRAAAAEAKLAQAEDSTPVPPMPDVFKLQFACSNGTFVAEFHKEWAPIGVAHLWELVHYNYYNDARFYRAMPGFMVQFGLAADPKETAKWKTNIGVDPVKQKNTRGMITYAMSAAGPHTRSTQLFINYGDNSGLDSDGFAPIGRVLTGMKVVDGINGEYGAAPGNAQGQITESGNTFLNQAFPNLDYIKTIKVLDAEPTAKDDDGDAENPHAEDGDTDDAHVEDGDKDDAVTN